jgi:hypothetical protein
MKLSGSRRPAWFQWRRRSYQRMTLGTQLVAIRIKACLHTCRYCDLYQGMPLGMPLPIRNWRGFSRGRAASQPSELIPRSELHPAEVVGSGRHLAQSAIARSDIRERETLMVEGIEDFGAYLKLVRLADLELFRD